jgi:hypothetical protein
MRSGSISEPPVGSPRAAMNVYDMAPPIARTSAWGARASNTASLSETLAPPSTTTSGRAGSRTTARCSISERSRSPAATRATCPAMPAVLA